MLRMLVRLALLVPVATASTVLVTVCGCGDSAGNGAVRIETVHEVFPSATDISTMSINRDPQESGPPGNPVFSEIRDSSGLLGYSVESDVAGRSGPFRIHVLLDEQYVVKKAAVISYPWSHGRQVRKRSFACQFEGKGPEDAIEIGNDIDAVTGATISCEAVARGVRQAVRLLAK
ncbi:MAG: FMN-binding protein [Planctomycetota bacterium]|jgi:Na+-translocating ferredoxin:NAD+ oxidoreductase RnfG subunit